MRYSTQEHEHGLDLARKAYRVYTSCKTDEQKEVAIRYVRLAIAKLYKIEFCTYLASDGLENLVSKHYKEKEKEKFEKWFQD